MNVKNILNEIEKVDPEVYERLDTRRSAMKQFAGLAGKLATVAVPFALGGMFKKAYGRNTGTDTVIDVLNFALTLEYFPNLSAKQLKFVIEKSAQVPPYKVTKPGSDEMVSMSELAKTGGIVNAYEALKIAATLKGERKIIKQVLPKPKLIIKE